MNDIPLTSEQSLFAAEHHGLVHAYLNKHHLSEDEYYDIIIFGYLEAVKHYFSDPQLRQYSFSTIAWWKMQGSLANYLRTQNRQKRSATIISLHIPLNNDGSSLEDTLSFRDELMTQMESRLLMHDLAKHISRRQLDIIRLRSSGYTNRDIAKRHKISLDQVNKLLNEIRAEIKALCYE